MLFPVDRPASRALWACASTAAAVAPPDGGSQAMNQDATKLVEALREAMQGAVNALTTYGLDVVGAVLILVFGLWIAGKTHRVVSRALGKAKRLDETLIGFFANAAKYGVVVFTVVAVLNQFGIETTSFIAVLGAAGLAIGLALQGTLSNVAAGVMLLIFRPYKIGDYVEAGGNAGTIEELNLFVTVMATPDNVRIIVPNARIWGATVANYSANPTRRVDLVMGISYADDIDKATAVMSQVIDDEARVLKDPEPMVAVAELADSSVNFAVRVWVDNADYWPVRFDLTKAMKQRFDAEGVSIPFPSQTVYHVNPPQTA
jgi:small conductance mechanosensitive channel